MFSAKIPIVLATTLLLAPLSFKPCLEKWYRHIIEPEVEDTQCTFHPGRSTAQTDFHSPSWVYAKYFYAYFVDLQKAYT